MVDIHLHYGGVSDMASLSAMQQDLMNRTVMAAQKKMEPKKPEIRYTIEIKKETLGYAWTVRRRGDYVASGLGITERGTTRRAQRAAGRAKRRDELRARPAKRIDVE